MKRRLRTINRFRGPRYKRGRTSRRTQKRRWGRAPRTGKPGIRRKRERLGPPRPTKWDQDRSTP